MLIPRADWINPADTREFEFPANYTISLFGIYGYIRPNKRGVRVTSVSGEAMTIEDPGIIDAYLRYCGEQIYLIILFTRMFALEAQASFLSNLDISTGDGNYRSWRWTTNIPLGFTGTPCSFYWNTAYWLRPERIKWKDFYWNEEVNLDENLEPTEQTFPKELVNSAVQIGNFSIDSSRSCSWQTSFAPIPSPIPWGQVPMEGIFTYQNSYRWKSTGWTGNPFPEDRIPNDLSLVGSSSLRANNYEASSLFKEQVGRTNLGYKFRTIDNSILLYEVAIKLTFSEEPPCDIPIGIDPIYRERGYFCMSNSEYGQLIQRFPQLVNQINTTNNLLRSFNNG